MLKLLAALISLGLGAPALAGPVYVMRHLERDAGKDPGLNAVGSAHAQALARWFRRSPPKLIYVTPFKRAQETAAPLARRLGLMPVSYDPNQPDAMLDAVRAAKGPVLIVGHSNTVPRIVQALGGPATPDLADSDYGRIWIVRQGKVTVARLAEPQPR